MSRPEFFVYDESHDLAIEQVNMLPVKAVEAGGVARAPCEASYYLCARKVSVAYAGRDAEIVLASDRLDLSVERGELACLPGPSGCGKTTFLNAVAGFLPVSSGELRRRPELSELVEALSKPVIASAAKQSRAAAPKLDCFAALAMTLLILGVALP